MQTIDKLRKFVEGGGLNKNDLANIQNFELSNLLSLDDTEQANYDNWKESKDWLTKLKLARRYARRFGTDEQIDQLTSAIKTQRRGTRDLSQADGVREGRLQAGLDNFENAMSSTTAKVGLNAAVGAVNAVDQMAMGDKNFGTQSETVHGLTSDMRFFIAYAGVWSANIRADEELRRTKVDEHSLGKNRVNGILPHVNAWYEAFNITPNDKMYITPQNRVKLW